VETGSATEGLRINATTMMLDSLEVKEDRFTFNIGFKLFGLEKENVYSWITLKVKCDLPSPHGIMSSNSKESLDIYVVNFDHFSPENTPKKMTTRIGRLLFPSDFGYLDSDEILMPIPPELSKKIEDCGAGRRGFPSGTSGNFVRMFYLSASTITTLGYGDIVPITTLTRILVSIEAVLGIVFIGLFLNALGYEKGKSENAVKHKDD
jgi:hypothetical protein